MKKKFLSLLIVLAMTLSMVPMASAAKQEGDEITGYGIIEGTTVGVLTPNGPKAADVDVSTATWAASGDTISTVEDFVKFMKFSGNVTGVLTADLDLGGMVFEPEDIGAKEHTLNSDDASTVRMIRDFSVNTTKNYVIYRANGAGIQNATIRMKYTGNGFVVARVAGTFTTESCSVLMDCTKDSGVCNTIESGSLTIDNCNIENAGASGRAVINSSANAQTSLAISNSTFRSRHGSAAVLVGGNVSTVTINATGVLLISGAETTGAASANSHYAEGSTMDCAFVQEKDPAEFDNETQLNASRAYGLGGSDFTGGLCDYQVEMRYHTNITADGKITPNMLAVDKKIDIARSNRRSAVIYGCAAAEMPGNFEPIPVTPDKYVIIQTSSASGNYRWHTMADAATTEQNLGQSVIVTRSDGSVTCSYRDDDACILTAESGGVTRYGVFSEIADNVWVYALPDGTVELTFKETNAGGNLVTTVRTLTLSEDEANPTPISATGDAVGTYEETVTVTDPDTGKVISETTTTVTGNTTADGTIWSTTSEVTEGAVNGPATVRFGAAAIDLPEGASAAVDSENNTIALTGAAETTVNGDTITGAGTLSTPNTDKAYTFTATGDGTINNGQDIALADGDVATIHKNGIVSVGYGTAGQTDYSKNGYAITYPDADPEGWWYVSPKAASKVAAAEKNIGLGKFDAGEWDPNSSTFFEVVQGGAPDTNDTGEPKTDATIHIPFNTAVLDQYVFGHWNATDKKWDELEPTADGESFVNVTTPSFSDFVFGTEAPYYYAEITLLDGAEDTLPMTDAEVAAMSAEPAVVDNAAENAAYKWNATEGKYLDEVGNQINDLKVGDKFQVDVKSSIPFLTAWVTVRFDSRFLELDAGSLSTKWVKNEKLSTDGGMQYYQLNAEAPADGEDVPAGTAMQRDNFQFTVKLPNDFTAGDEGPLEIPFEIVADEKLSNLTNSDSSGTAIPMAAKNTLVRIAGTEPLQEIEVVQYGADAALILVYTDELGQFTYKDSKVLTNTSTVLADVTKAGYIYRYAPNASAAEDSDEYAAAQFYLKLGNTIANGQRAAKVYGVVVSLSRLQNASGFTVAGAQQHDVEAYVRERLTFDRNTGSTQVSYTSGTDVDQDGKVLSNDQTEVVAISLMTGSDLAAEKGNSAKGWAKAQNEAIKSRPLNVLRCDFNRTNQAVNVDTKNVNENEVSAVREAFAVNG